MSTYHIAPERDKSPSSLSPLNGSVGNTIAVFHRIPIVNNRVRSPISGKVKDISDVLTAIPQLKTFIFASIDGSRSGNGALQIILPEIDRDRFHTSHWMKLIDNVYVPQILNVDVDSGSSAGGTSITITGSNFAAPVAVKFSTDISGIESNGSLATNVVVVSATSITCTTPAGAAGAAYIIISNCQGNSNPFGWRYI